MRTCSKCRLDKPAAAFSSPRCHRCRDCDYGYTSQGLTVEQYRQLYEAQSGRCALCGDAGELVADRDFVTSQLRDLVCRACRLALRRASLTLPTDPAIRAYLTRHGESFAEAS